MATNLTMPLGKHRGTPLADVPESYLAWLLREVKLSTGLRAAVAAELERRGVRPPTAAVKPEPVCCGAGLSYGWDRDALGRPIIRRWCAACGRCLGLAPQTGAALEAANAAGRPMAQGAGV
jgi:hypothetical protein